VKTTKREFFSRVFFIVKIHFHTHPRKDVKQL